MAEEIKQRITLEGAERIEALLREISLEEEMLAQKTAKVGDAATTATPKIDRQNEATKDLGTNAKNAAGDASKLAHETDKAGDAASVSSGKIDRASKSHNGLTSAIKGSISSYVGWTAVISTVVAGLTEVFRVASNATDAVKTLGEQLNGLSVNQGGKVADQTVRDINAIAQMQSLNVSGRNELIGAAGTLTDLNPNITQSDLHEQLVNIARLRKAAGSAAGSGSDAAELLVTAQAKGNLTPGQAADQVGALLTSGFEQKNLGDLYRRGDTDLITALYGARGKGLDLTRSASALPQIMSALDRRDGQGQLSPELLAAGITDDMSTTQRMQAVQSALQAGRITPAQQLNLLGGYQTRDVAGPLLQAVTPEALQTSRQEIQGTTLDQLLALRGQSRYVQVADRGAKRDLIDQLMLEQSSLAGVGEAMQDMGVRLRQQGGGSAMLGLLRETNIGSVDFDSISRRSPIIQIGQQYNMGTDGESPLTRPVGDGLE